MVAMWISPGILPNPLLLNSPYPNSQKVLSQSDFIFLNSILQNKDLFKFTAARIHKITGMNPRTSLEPKYNPRGGGLMFVRIKFIIQNKGLNNLPYIRLCELCVLDFIYIFKFCFNKRTRENQI
jgi:hypothetical protein